METKAVKRIKINGKEITVVEAEVEFYRERDSIVGFRLTFETDKAVPGIYDWMTDDRKPTTSEVEFVLFNYAETYRGHAHISQGRGYRYVAEGDGVQRLQ